MKSVVRSEVPIDGVTLITLDDPPMNFGTLEMMGQLHQLLCEASEAGSRVVILASDTPGVFMTHAYLPDVLAAHDGSIGTGDSRNWFRVVRLLENGPFLTIAANGGRAWGAGAELSWACHLRIASRSATYAQPEIFLELVPGLGGVSRLARLAGESVCMRMVLDGRPVTAEECERWGLVHRVVADHELRDAALLWAKDLATRSPKAVKACVEAITFGRNTSLETALRLDASYLSKLIATRSARDVVRQVQVRYDEGAEPELALGMQNEG